MEIGYFCGMFNNGCGKNQMKIAHESKIRLWEAVANGTFEIIIQHMVKEYQEIFSDLFAFIILDFDMDNYYVAFRISGGFDVNQNNWFP